MHYTAQRCFTVCASNSVYTPELIHHSKQENLRNKMQRKKNNFTSYIHSLYPSNIVVAFPFRLFEIIPISMFCFPARCPCHNCFPFFSGSAFTTVKFGKIDSPSRSLCLPITEVNKFTKKIIFTKHEIMSVFIYIRYTRVGERKSKWLFRV